MPGIQKCGLFSQPWEILLIIYTIQCNISKREIWFNYFKSCISVQTSSIFHRFFKLFKEVQEKTKCKFFMSFLWYILYLMALDRGWRVSLRLRATPDNDEKKKQRHTLKVAFDCFYELIFFLRVFKTKVIKWEQLI